MIAMMEELLTVEEVARILRVTEYTVREKIRSGELEGFKLGGRGAWRIRPNALRRYLEEDQRKPESKN